MNINDTALAQEFQRQIYLCSRLGYEAMINLLEMAFAVGVQKYVCYKCGLDAGFGRAHFCPESPTRKTQ